MVRRETGSDSFAIELPVDPGAYRFYVMGSDSIGVLPREVELSVSAVGVVESWHRVATAAEMGQLGEQVVVVKEMVWYGASGLGGGESR